MNPNQSIQLTVASSILSQDGTGVTISYNPPPPIVLTWSQLSFQLSQSQSKLDQLNKQVSIEMSNIARIQGQLALAQPIVAAPLNP